MRLGIEILTNLQKRNLKINNQAGFTLIEMLAVLVMIGILSAIAAPSWLGFVERQRINKASDVLLTALRDAQQEAKNKKVDYSVSFQNRNKIPMYAVHRGRTAPANTSSIWKSLGEEIGLKSEQFLIYTNLDSSKANKKASAALNQTPVSDNSPVTISFDYMGTLPDADFAVGGTKEQIGFQIAIATPQSKTSTTPGNLRRCVIIDTLVGGTRTKKNTECT
jgi:prepilin-type N-terminal cleavage/methylation domain-containing protein